MAKIRIVGDSSGYVELAAPNAAGNNTLELPSNATKLVGADASNSLNVTGIATFSGGIVGNVTGNVNATGLSTFTSGINVGTGASISSPATNVLTLGTNNVERVRINSTGHVGILSTLSIGTNTQVTSSTGLNPVITVGSATTSRLVWGTPGSDNYRLNLSGGGALVFGVDGDSENFGIEGHQTGVQHVRYLTIDNYGRMSIPYQPAFSASGANTNVNYSGGAIFQFNVADLNVGNHFDTSNYRFTAPVTGFYLFGAAIYVNGNLSACFTVNGSQVYGGGDPQPLLYTTAAGITISGQIQLSLAAGDIVDFRSRDGAASNTIYMGHSNFWGRLVG